MESFGENTLAAIMELEDISQIKSSQKDAACKTTGVGGILTSRNNATNIMKNLPKGSKINVSDNLGYYEKCIPGIVQFNQRYQNRDKSKINISKKLLPKSSSKGELQITITNERTVNHITSSINPTAIGDSFNSTDLHFNKDMTETKVIDVKGITNVSKYFNDTDFSVDSKLLTEKNISRNVLTIPERNVKKTHNSFDGNIIIHSPYSIENQSLECANIANTSSFIFDSDTEQINVLDQPINLEDLCSSTFLSTINGTTDTENVIVNKTNPENSKYIVNSERNIFEKSVHVSSNILDQQNRAIKNHNDLNDEEINTENVTFTSQAHINIGSMNHRQCEINHCNEPDDETFFEESELMISVNILNPVSIDSARPLSVSAKTETNKTLHISSDLIASNCNIDYEMLIKGTTVNTSKSILTDSIDIQNSLSTNAVTHNLAVPSTSNFMLSSQEKLLLKNWGLPEEILTQYASRGVTTMFPWQVDCLRTPDVLEHDANLVYSAPTSAGKTLVAEIITIKTVLERHKKVIIILPFVSVVREKMYYFQDILGSSGVRVSGFMGSHSPPGGFQACHVAISTIEKANSLLNRMLEENSLSDVGAVIVDELHLLGDPGRGYILELMLTKIKYMTFKNDNINIQIIGMSATLPNLDLLARWLNAKLYSTDFRPIPLAEQCKMENTFYDNHLNVIRHFTPYENFPRDPDNIIQLCIETISIDCSVLIFCPTKVWCENLSVQLSDAFMKLGKSNHPVGAILREQLNGVKIYEVLEQLKNCPVGLDALLGKTIAYSSAFHHAGLTMDERDIIEGGFRSSAIRVLVATSTLSSGVNLPARRVIIRSPIFHGKPINALTYRQMIGRAGRMGKDTHGESVLICQKKDINIVHELLSINLQPITSCLEGEGKLKRAILEVIASGVASSPNDIDIFTNCTLLSMSKSDKSINDGETLENTECPIAYTMKYLIDCELIRMQDSEHGPIYVATPLGKACLSSSLPPEDGLTLFTELQQARQCFVLETELHIIYMVTPYSVSSQLGNIDWLLVLNLWEKLPAAMKRVGQLVGIQEGFLVQAMKGALSLNTPKMVHKMQVHRRFYTALALQELVNEVPLSTVAQKYKCSRGVLQSLQQSAATFAGMVTSFSHQLGWNSVELLVSQFQDRLQFGIQRELLDLMRLPMLNGLRARAIYNAGIQTVVHLASADECVLENALHSAIPFQSEKNREGECEYDTKSRNKLKSIWVTGKSGLTPREAAVLLISDARKYLEIEMGLSGARWGTNKSGDSSSAVNASPKANIVSHKHLESDNHEVISSPEIIHPVDIIENTSADVNTISDSAPTTIKIISEIEITPQGVNNSSAAILDNRTPVQEVSITNDNKPVISQSVLKSMSICESLENRQIQVLDLEITAKDITGAQDRFGIKDTYVWHSMSCERTISELVSDCVKTERNDNMVSVKRCSPEISKITKRVREENVAGSTNMFEEGCNLNVHNVVDSLKTKTQNIEPKSSINTNDLQANTNTNAELGKEAPLQSMIENTTRNEHLSGKKRCSPESSESTKKSRKDDFAETLMFEDSFDLNLYNIEDASKNITPNAKLNSKMSVNDLPQSSTESSNNGFKSYQNMIEKELHLLNNVENTGGTKSSIFVTAVKFTEGVRKLSVDSNDIICSSQEDVDSKSINIKQLLKTQKSFKQSKSGKVSSLKHQQIREIAATKSKGNKNYAEIKVSYEKFSPVKVQSCQKAQNASVNMSSVDSSVMERKDIAIVLSKSLKVTKLPKTLEVINVASKLQIFHAFSRNIKNKREIALALHYENIVEKPTIGLKIVQTVDGLKEHRESIRHSCIVDNCYISGLFLYYGGTNVYFLSLQDDDADANLPLSARLGLLNCIFRTKNRVLLVSDSKHQYQMLYKGCDLEIECNVEDPQVAYWMLNPDEESHSLRQIAETQCTEVLALCKRLNSKSRASREVVITWFVMYELQKALELLDTRLIKAFRDTEMKSLILIARCELNGMPFDTAEMQKLHIVIQNQMSAIEAEAYSLAGKKFSISSSTDVAKVLGMFKGHKVKTNKQVLETVENPLSPLIILWRKLSHTLSKVVFPMLRNVKSDRLYGHSITNTLTGRITMKEPSIQNVTKDFSIRNGQLKISCRSVFKASPGRIIVSADYCQLELRILTHFSQDSTLLEIMKSGEDVFKVMAANWNCICESEVTEDLRNRTKQLIYAMIYGMGMPSLAQVLEVTELEASSFLDSFHSAYPGLKRFLTETIKQCQQNGYIETINGRRRYLPNIDHTSLTRRGQAERQAVNTKVQGSAADIAKTAMTLVDQNVRLELPFAQTVLNKSTEQQATAGIYFVLHLHDELIYEVSEGLLEEFAAILKRSMETAVPLSVPFPVRVKAGDSWGNLKEFIVRN